MLDHLAHTSVTERHRTDFPVFTGLVLNRYADRYLAAPGAFVCAPKGERGPLDNLGLAAIVIRWVKLSHVGLSRSQWRPGGPCSWWGAFLCQFDDIEEVQRHANSAETGREFTFNLVR